MSANPPELFRLVPTSMAISAFIEETERLARKAGYRFKLIPPP